MMNWRGGLRGRIFLLLLALLAACSCSEKANFECPEQFGYYPDGNDCNRYFVCVFGGALHESCTGGLFFSVDLQTCDWPRNVKCNAENGVRSNNTENSDHSSVSTSTAASSSTSRTAAATKPLTPKTPSAPTEVSTARKVPNEAPHQSVIHEPGASNPSTSRTPIVSPPSSVIASTVNNVAKEPAKTQSQLAAEEELLVEGFTEVYDVPRTVAKVKGAKCYGCQPSNQPTTRTRLQSDDDSVSRQGNPSIDVTFHPMENHRGTGPRAASSTNQDSMVQVEIGTQQTPPPVVTVQSVEDMGNDGADDLQTPQSSHYDDYYDPEGFETNRDIEDTGEPSPGVTASTTTKATSPPLQPTTSAPRRSHRIRQASDSPAKRCDPTVCRLPTCFCGGNQIVPGGLKPDDIPQMVLITFDDAINDINWPLYEQLFYKGRKNPHGCSISATFYVSHEWTDYGKVQTLYSDGNEIASHSITHSYGEDFVKSKWEEEIYGQKEILKTYAGIKLDDIRGMRAPFLQIGGNPQYAMLYENNFTYDSSMPVYENKPPFWPYTLDYAIPHECMIPPCPTHSFPGIWEIPLVMWVDLNGGRCSMADACSNPPTAEGVYKMLVKNFERHYLTNRAPFGLFYHSAWFAIPHHREGFEAFLDALVTMNDVYIITSSQLIDWMRNPTPLNKIKTFPPWQCHHRDRIAPCKKPKVCNLWFKGGVRYMKTCQPCPSVYPWINNTGSQNKTGAS